MTTMIFVTKEPRGTGYTRSTAHCSLRLTPHPRYWGTNISSGIVTPTFNVCLFVCYWGPNEHFPCRSDVQKDSTNTVGDDIKCSLSKPKDIFSAISPKTFDDFDGDLLVYAPDTKHQGTPRLFRSNDDPHTSQAGRYCSWSHVNGWTLLWEDATMIPPDEACMFCCDRSVENVVHRLK